VFRAFALIVLLVPHTIETDFNNRRRVSLAVLAVQHIRRMRGGAQGQLMLGADGYAYVVKF